MKPHSGCPLNTEMKLKGSANHRWTFPLQGHRAAGQNAPAKREVWPDWGGWARGAPRPGPRPASAAPKWERGQSPGPNEKWQTAALGEGTQRYGVRAACGSQSSLGGQASTQPASSPPLGLITLPEGRHHPAQALQASGDGGL